MDKLAVDPHPQLRRRIGPVLLTMYGVGVMVGAGIYVLVGAVAGEAGVLSPLAFLMAGLIAAPTALTYAELSVRIPESGGEAAYVRHGLRTDQLALAVGLVIVAVGVTSAAAVLRGGADYATGLVAAPKPLVILLIGAALILVAVIGVVESLTVAAAFTVAEVIGLILVIRAGIVAPPSSDWLAGAPAELPVAGLGVATGLAFFAFIGFEDIVNLAEETRRPSRTLPIAILGSLIIASILYGAVAIAAVRVVDVDLLADSERPLTLVVEAARGGSGDLLAAIAVVAALNGVLAQIVMAARVLFGLGRAHQGRWLKPFHRVHPRFGTPVTATLTIGGAVLIGGLTIELVSLAQLTSALLLAVFAVVNATLLVIKRRGGTADFTVPTLIPWLGLAGSLAALGFSIVG